MQVSISRLSQLTGLHRDTIKKRIGPILHGTRCEKVDSHKALRLIYGAGDALNLDAEKARLTHHQANIAALAEADKRENLIPADAVRERWRAMSASIRARLLKLPPRLAEAVTGHDTTQAAERAAMQIVREALTEISRSGSEETPPGNPG